MALKKATKQNRPVKTVQEGLFGNDVDVFKKYVSPYKYIGNWRIDETIEYYNNLKNDETHYNSNDDVCTPMECVEKMVEYIPSELWYREKIRVLEPCAGNGNFVAYCKFKTKIDNIWVNELNEIRFKNCKKILKPKHILHEDFFALKEEWASNFDLIITNPPYSGGGNKNKSISNQFIERSIDMLNDNGYLCFVTPNNWMTYNSDNKTLKKLLNNGSFIIIDNTAKKFFNGIGSSFTIFVWQKGVFNNITTVYNNYLLKDVQNVNIPKNIPFIPLYLSQTVIDMIPKIVINERNKFDYRCDLHNFTQKKHLSDIKDKKFKYETIHTLRKTRYADIKQDIYDGWVIVVPLSTYYIPVIKHNVNITQSVGYFYFDAEEKAQEYLKKIVKPCYKLIIHLTRYGNFNNIMVLRHINFDNKIKFTKKELAEIDKLVSLINY